MAIEGEDLGAELHSMQVAGQVTLPSVAAVYAQGSRHVHNSSWRETETFESEYTEYEWETGEDVESLPGDDSGVRIEVTAGRALGRVYGPWTALRDTAQRMMADTSNALADAGTALVMIANAYAGRDGEAATEMDRLADVNSDDMLAPTIPEVKYPTSDHDTRTEEYRIGIPGTDVGWDIETEVPVEEPTDPLEN